MNRTLWMGLLCAALHLCPLQAEEADAPAAQEEAIPAAVVHAEAVFKQYLARTIETLAASGKARNLALAAMMLYDDSLPPALRAQQETLWRTALDTAGGDAMVTHMVVMGWRRAGEPTAQDSALRQQAARLWHTLEPSNLAPMLYLEQPLEPLLAQAASSVYVDLHLYALGRWIHSILRSHPPTAQELQAFAAADAAIPEENQRLGGWDNLLAMLTVGTQYALSWPDYMRLRNACKPEELHLYPTRKPACQHAAYVMVQRSTDALQELLGTRMLLDLTPTAHECQRLKINGSRLRWRMQRASEWHAQDRDIGYIQHFLQDGSIQREQDAVESYLRKKKQPTEPPTDWIDPFYADIPC